MKRARLFFLSIVLTALPYVTSAFGDRSLSPDWTLSLLRGTWEYHTFEEKFTLLFNSDEKMIFNGADAEYAVTPKVLRIFTNDDEFEMSYTLTNDRLRLTDPDGHQITYERVDVGDEEQLLDGEFFLADDSSSVRDVIVFKQGRKFFIDAARNGLYRIVENTIILTSIDGTYDKAIIRFNDTEGMISVITYRDQVYQKESAANFQPNPPIAVYEPLPPPIPEPVPEPFPWPDPYPDPPPCPPPGHPIDIIQLIIDLWPNSTSSEEKEVNHGSRDFGTSRTGDNNSSKKAERPVGGRRR